MVIALALRSGLSGRGGMERSTSIAIREWEKNGDTVHIIMQDKGEDLSWSVDFNCHYIGFSGNKFWGYFLNNRLIRNSLYKYRLTMLLKKIKPDIVLGLDQHAIAASRFYRYLSRNKVRVGSWIRFSLQALGKNPQKNLRHASFHLAISSGIAHDFNRLFPNNEKSVYLIYNPIQAVEKTITRPSRPTFLFVGRLVNKQKRIHDFLQALAELKGNWRAIIIGDGSDANQLKQLAQDLNINDRIDWAGWKREPWDYATEASVLVLTSAYEGFGNVLAEAIIRGLPCISSDCPDGPSDIIVEGKNGWLYPLNDLDKLRDLMQNVVDAPLTGLPDQQLVKESGKRFSTENYFANLHTALMTEVSKIK